MNKKLHIRNNTAFFMTFASRTETVKDFLTVCQGRDGLSACWVRD